MHNTVATMQSYNPAICMAKHADFVTFRGLETPILGHLTDKAISQYKLMGKYGETIRLHEIARCELQKLNRTRKTHSRKTVEELLTEYST